MIFLFCSIHSILIMQYFLTYCLKQFSLSWTMSVFTINFKNVLKLKLYNILQLTFPFNLYLLGGMKSFKKDNIFYTKESHNSLIWSCDRYANRYHNNYLTSVEISTRFLLNLKFSRSAKQEWTVLYVSRSPKLQYGV